VGPTLALCVRAFEECGFFFKKGLGVTTSRSAASLVQQWPPWQLCQVGQRTVRLAGHALQHVAQVKQQFCLWPGYQLACRHRHSILLCVADPNFAHGACRLEEAQEAAAGLREQLTEARRHLREVMDEEKEHKKKRRAAALALATVRPCCCKNILF
jgi:hypothetical protein